MSRTLHLFGTDWGAMMVPIQVIRWYRMQCYDGTDSCATVVPIRRYCQEGIVLTYHPYQIDCFAAGEYHAVIPFKDANKCLMFDYSQYEDLKPKLQRFIKW